MPPKRPGEEANDRVLPEIVHAGEQHQTTVNENERAAPVKREPSYRARRQHAVRWKTSSGTCVRSSSRTTEGSLQPTRTRTAPTAVVQLFEIAVAYRQTTLKALSLARPQNNSEAKEAPGTPAELDLSDPAGTIEALRSFDHADFLQTIAKTGSMIRKLQKRFKGYHERAKSKNAFRDSAVGDFALFCPLDRVKGTN